MREGKRQCVLGQSVVHTPGAAQAFLHEGNTADLSQQTLLPMHNPM